MNPHAWTLDLIVPGERYVAGIRRPCQDHAVARATAHGWAVAVSDGVSLIPGPERSATQCGAVLCAEVAVAAALAELSERPSSAYRVGERVAEELGEALGHLVDQLGRLGGPVQHPHRKLLCGTLLLGVRTPEWAAVWAVGDGMAGIVLDPEHGQPFRTAEQAHDTLGVRVGPADGRCSLLWGAHLAQLSRSHVLPEALLWRDGFHPSGLQRVLDVRGPAEAVWVATDGLCHEWPLGLRLGLRGTTRRDDAHDLLERGAGADDLAVAAAAAPGWAITPGCEVRP